ncbi:MULTISPECIES: hypothetical protein [Streptomyces]|nr:hypothetical protein [Streptomyces sp. DH20]MCP9989229.1 hypothetical protein [Streptomyces albogriseolus]
MTEIHHREFDLLIDISFLQVILEPVCTPALHRLEVGTLVVDPRITSV